MNSRVTFKEILSMFLVIVSFLTTGILIMNENYRYALIALCAAAFCVLLAFAAVIAGDEDKILDLSNPNLRNPRRGSSSKKVRYIDRLTPDMSGRKDKPKSKKNDSGSADTYPINIQDTEDFHESVGNMRVYKRGEKIERYTDKDEEDR